MFTKEVVGCFCHGGVLAVGQGVYFGVLIFMGEEWSKLSSYCCSKNVCDVGVLEFIQTEPYPYSALGFFFLFVCFVLVFFLPLETEPEGHHYKFMVTSISASGKFLVFAMLTLDWKRLTMM